MMKWHARKLNSIPISDGIHIVDNEDADKRVTNVLNQKGAPKI